MTRIRCRDRGCVFNKSGICSAEEIEYEPDAGCLTMEPRAAADGDEEEWEDEDEELEEASLDDEDEREEDDDWEENDGESEPGLRRRRR